MNPKEITFQKLEGSVVVIMKANGSYSQHDAWVRRGEVYAKIGSGFAQIRRHGTSMNGITIKDYDLGTDVEFGYTATGRLVIADHPHFNEPADSSFTSNIPEPEEEVKPKPKSKRTSK